MGFAASEVAPRTRACARRCVLTGPAETGAKKVITPRGQTSHALVVPVPWADRLRRAGAAARLVR